MEPPPWIKVLRKEIRQDVAKLLNESSNRLLEHRGSGVSPGPEKLPETEHVEIRQIHSSTVHTAESAEEQVQCHVAFRREWLEHNGIDPARCALLGVDGESMEPTVPKGSSILIDCTRRRLRDNRVFVVRVEDGLAVKRAARDAEGHWRLVSDHPSWPDAPWPSDARVIGEVRWVATSIA